MRPVIVQLDNYKLFCMPAPGRAASRPHAFAMSSEGRARIWLKPNVEVDLTFKTRLGERQLEEVRLLVEQNFDDLIAAWED